MYRRFMRSWLEGRGFSPFLQVLITSRRGGVGFEALVERAALMLVVLLDVVRTRLSNRMKLSKINYQEKLASFALQTAKGINVNTKDEVSNKVSSTFLTSAQDTVDENSSNPLQIQEVSRLNIDNTGFSRRGGGGNADF
ncbi:hypothetical protein [Anaplasma platys]|uniref:hypothetical protein n=1 Tax=Anaplasma platys TaxID=949 RepID=UPI00145DA08F|nr:hypothetical protein [Anaplasma platys]